MLPEDSGAKLPTEGSPTLPLPPSVTLLSIKTGASIIIPILQMGKLKSQEKVNHLPDSPKKSLALGS